MVLPWHFSMECFGEVSSVISPETSGISGMADLWFVKKYIFNSVVSGALSPLWKNLQRFVIHKVVLPAVINWL